MTSCPPTYNYFRNVKADVCSVGLLVARVSYSGLPNLTDVFGNVGERTVDLAQVLEWLVTRQLVIEPFAKKQAAKLILRWWRRMRLFRAMMTYVGDIGMYRLAKKGFGDLSQELQKRATSVSSSSLQNNPRPKNT